MTDLAYFDNAATTFPKPCSVYEYADNFYRQYGGNIGRGNNPLAASANKIEREAKENIKTLYDCQESEVVFTASATDALNRILLGIDFAAGDYVYITPFEHNAVTRTLHHLEKTKGIIIKELLFEPVSLLPDMNGIKEQIINSTPKLIVMTHASNVCGAIVPVFDICELVKRHSHATTVIDMSQTAGLISLDLSSDLIDYAVFAGHKTLLAPFGIGGFICKPSARLKPVLFGGNGIDSLQQSMPEELVDMIQVGSQNTYAIAGLKASTDWIINQSMKKIYDCEKATTEALISLIGEYDEIEIVPDTMKCSRVGVVSCLFDDYSPDEVELLLGKNGVAVRSGLHCAPTAHRFLGTLPAGTVRFSVSSLTTDDDMVSLKRALDKIMEN